MTLAARSIAYYDRETALTGFFATDDSERYERAGIALLAIPPVSRRVPALRSWSAVL